VDGNFLIIVLLIFLLAGAVKGMIGLGLPTVSLALLTLVTDLPHAMTLLLVPSLFTNLWQAAVGGYGKEIWCRFWPFLLACAAMIWPSSALLRIVDLWQLTALLGGLLLVYGVTSLAGCRLKVARPQERWAGPVLGAINGILTGMTGSFVVPGVLFLQAIDLPRNFLIQAMGTLFAVSTVSLAVAMRGQGYLTMDNGLVSIAGLIPAIVGMWLGQRFRDRLSDDLFKKMFYSALLIVGVYIVIRAVW